MGKTLIFFILMQYMPALLGIIESITPAGLKLHSSKRDFSNSINSSSRWTDTDFLTGSDSHGFFFLWEAACTNETVEPFLMNILG